MIHRDIKPQNLLLRSGGTAGDRLLVADLGVAKAMLHATGLTQVVGTPSYMAPEQATGVGVDARADVHALAAVAYQMLTGRLVRTSSISELAGATLPPAPSHIVDLPTAVDDVLLRALQPAPAERWPDVETFTAALRAALPTPGPGPDQLTLWETPAGTGESALERRPLWPVVLISLLVFVAAFAAAYAVTSLF